MDTDWIAIGEAADLLQVSRDTLRRWEKKGKIKSYRSPSNRRMYKRSEILASYQEGYEEETNIMPPHAPIIPPPIHQTPNTFTPYRPAIAPESHPFTIPHTSNQNSPTQTPPVYTPPISFPMATNNDIYTPSPKSTEPFSQDNEVLPTKIEFPELSNTRIDPAFTESNEIPQITEPKKTPNYNIPAFTYAKPNLTINTPQNNSNIQPETKSQEPINNQFTPLPISPFTTAEIKSEPTIPIPTSIPVIPPPPVYKNTTPEQPPIPTSSYTFTPTVTSPLNNKFRILDLDINEEPAPETSTGNIKILKIITAVLIAILIILGIAIFSIIFVQYS